MPTALYLFGMMTERGLGMQADPVAAVDLFRQAAEKGNRPSQARWGMALMKGQGVAANPIEGKSWLRRAALPGTRKRRPWSATFTPRAGGCRRTMPRRQSGFAAPRKSGIAVRPARWVCCI